MLQSTFSPNVSKYRFAFAGLVVASLLGTAAQAGARDNSGAAMLDQFATYWTGAYSNERQVRLNQDRLVPDYPELVRLNRDMVVYRLEESDLGDIVLFLEEVKADAPDLAHRQRVMTLEWLEETQEIHVVQHFFAEELSYDRQRISAETAAALDEDDFTLYSSCDLYFVWEQELARFKGGMRPQSCEYDHPESGRVYAEFDMILSEHQLLYRDRSIILATGNIRGEIDGFSWLRFDKLSAEPILANGDRISRAELMRRMPAAGSMEGVWEGTFTRVDANGKILESFPSRIEARFLPDGETYDFYQTNTYRPGTDEATTIESYGKWDVDRLHFFNDRLEGWSKDIDLDPLGLTSVFLMKFRDGSLTVSEIISRDAEDPDRRMRATQYMQGGKIVRRTLIDERRVETFGE